MTEAERAFEAAQMIIAAVLANKGEGITFSSDKFHALEALPDSIGLLTSLKKLYLSGTQISDVTHLANLTELKDLRLKNTLIRDAAPLADLRALRSLDLRNTRISDATPLADLTALGSLSLDNTDINDATPLADLTSLVILGLGNTRISDITPLTNLTALETLFLNNTQITNVTPLANLTDLRDLQLDNTPLSDVAPLANLTALMQLGLSNTKITDAAPIANLTALIRLVLSNTQVSDATPLVSLKALEQLYLDNTPISDLRPLLALERPGEKRTFDEVTFNNTAASDLDPRVAEIAKIEPHEVRAQTLFDYLRDWEPPDTLAEDLPQPDDVFAVDVEDGRLEVATSSPTEAERDEALKQSMHEMLKDVAERLTRAAGNQFPRLSDAARRLRDILDCPFEELEMPHVFLSLSDFRAALRSGKEDDQSYPEQITSLLDQVMTAGPALTVDNPDVERIMERAHRYREDPDPEEDRNAQNAMTHVVVKDKNAFGERLRRLEDRLAERDDPEGIVAQKSVNRNVLWRIAMGALADTRSLAVGITGSIIATSYGPAITEFTAANWTILTETAKTYGPVFSDWFIASASRLQEVAAVITSSERRLK